MREKTNRNYQGISSLIMLITIGFATTFLYSRCSSPEVKEEIAVDDAAEQELHNKATSIFKSISSIEREDIDENKILLGKKLYHDKSLSKDGNISCASCHNLNTYGVDNLSFSPGDTKELGGRNSPSSVYAFLHSIQFWDGRAKDVEEQAGGPLLNPVEHSVPSQAFLENRLRKNEEYQKLFKAVYPNDAQPITFTNITNAIGAFERQLAPESRFDKWLDGDKNALTAQEKAGLTAFIDNACITCHMGPAVGGDLMQKFGLYGNYWEKTNSKKVDNGVYDLSKKESDKYVFKVPSLRNVEKTYPYFHDGSVEKLEDAVSIMAELQLGKKISDEEVKNITAFLKSMTAEVDPKYIAE
ncbi:MAG: c-type cytochrome [Crocinitomicaceae bacterium]|nr:c-type cytochrome [Crocinitomicaceae bacterium]